MDNIEDDLDKQQQTENDCTTSQTDDSLELIPEF